MCLCLHHQHALTDWKTASPSPPLGPTLLCIKDGKSIDTCKGAWSTLTVGHVWRQMDEEAAGLANGRARLMTAEELPAWVTSPPPATNGASAASDLVGPPSLIGPLSSNLAFYLCQMSIRSGQLLSHDPHAHGLLPLPADGVRSLPPQPTPKDSLQGCEKAQSVRNLGGCPPTNTQRLMSGM